MQIEPQAPAFAKRYARGEPQVVWTTLVSDLETPVSAFLKIGGERPMSFLLESVEGGSVRGRYSIIGLKPDLIWHCRGDVAELNRRARSDADAFEREPKPALASLKDLIAACRVETPAPLPPMASGLFGYMGYNMVGLMERLPDKNPDTLGIPDGMFLRPTIVCIFDNLQDRVTLVTPAWPNAELGARAAYDLARERLAEGLTDFERSPPYRREAQDAIAELPVPKGNIPREACMRMVETAKEQIRAGEIFQVVPSMRFEGPFRLPPFALYPPPPRPNP